MNQGGMSLQIAALRDGYAEGRTDPVAVIEAVLARVAAYGDPAVWISRVSADVVRARAAGLARLQAEDARAASRLPLFGIPFAVKDTIDVAGMQTSAACPAFAYTAAADAFVVRLLIEAGAILIGKTNLDQFATGLVGTRSPYGAPRCVFSAAHVSGGSSSGSAVAVAAGLVSFALGTDTAGSGRVPAAFNNLVGVKPSKGLLSTSGLVPACRSLDCISIFAATLGDARRVFDVAAQFDADDCFARRVDFTPLPLDRFKFGVLAAADRDFAGDDEAAGLYEAAITRLRDLGGVPDTLDYTPFREAAALLYGGPYVAERLAAIRTFHAQHADAMDPVVRGIIDGAQHFSAADCFAAQYRLRALMREAEAQWRRFDVLLLPTTPSIFTVAAVQADPIRLNSQLGLYTNFVNLLDLAAIAVPAGFRASNGLPFGVTLIAPAGTDPALFVLADRLHRATGDGVGGAREPFYAAPLAVDAPASGRVALAVAGAHMSGMPLNGVLLELGGRLLGPDRTSPDYQLYALPGTGVARPGLVRQPGAKGPGIEIEIWDLDPAAFGRFVAGIAAPLGVGRIELANGSEVSGFLCEAYVAAFARDITETGGWRAYQRQQ